MKLGKMCNRCGLYKGSDAFYSDRSKYSGLSHRCKECKRAEDRKRYRQNPTKYLNKNNKWNQSPEGRRYNTEWHRSAKGRQRRYHYHRDNKEYIKDYNKRYYQQHTEYLCQRAKQHAKQHPGRKKLLDREYGKYWRRENPEKLCEIAARRKAAYLQAIPPWADKDKIRKMYEACYKLTKQTGTSHEVDHIVPLQNDNVCGLHCEANLRIITSSENRRKKNNWPCDT